MAIKKGIKQVTSNKKAWHDYFVDEKFEAGIELVGTEVKALREGTSIVTPKWLTFDAPNLTGTVNALPAREDLDLQLQENMIVEFYSR